MQPTSCALFGECFEATLDCLVTHALSERAQHLPPTSCCIVLSASVLRKQARCLMRLSERARTLATVNQHRVRLGVLLSASVSREQARCLMRLSETCNRQPTSCCIVLSASVVSNVSREQARCLMRLTERARTLATNIVCSYQQVFQGNSHALVCILQ